MKRRGFIASLLAPLIARLMPKKARAGFRLPYKSATTTNETFVDPLGRSWMLMPGHSDTELRPDPIAFDAEIRAEIGDTVNVPVLDRRISGFGNLAYRRIS